MSNTDGMRVWVGDLDDYIDIDQIDRWNEQEEREAALRDELDAIGDLQLLDGRRTSATALNAKGITPDEWRWAVHEAEKSLSGTNDPQDLERGLVQGLLAIGRPYAIGRHARWERLTLASARTAVQPFGLLALIDQQLTELDSTAAPDARRSVRAAIRKAEASGGLVAYERTALVRTTILRAMDVANAGKAGRERMRVMLSLIRLRFSALEANVRSFDELRALDGLYEAARSRSADTATPAPTNARAVRNWSLRHIHPLTFLMPIAVRAALDRGSAHLPLRHPMPVIHPGSPPPARIERTQAVNELALARCATILIGRLARQR